MRHQIFTKIQRSLNSDNIFIPELLHFEVILESIQLLSIPSDCDDYI